MGPVRLRPALEHPVYEGHLYRVGPRPLQEVRRGCVGVDVPFFLLSPTAKTKVKW